MTPDEMLMADIKEAITIYAERKGVEIDDTFLKDLAWDLYSEIKTCKDFEE